MKLIRLIKLGWLASITSMALCIAPMQASAQEDGTSGDTLQQILTTLNNIGLLMNNTILSSASVVAELLYTQSPGIYGTIAANLNALQAQDVARSRSKTQIDTLLARMLTPDAQSDTPPLFQLMPGVAGTDPTTQLPNFNMANFAGKVAFETKNEANQAQNFIRLLADMDNTPKSLPASAFANLSPQAQNYLTRLATYTATQSIALNNLTKMYAERVQQSGLGDQVGMVKLTSDAPPSNVSVGAPVDTASPLQVEEYLAARRVKNGAWYAEMEKAAPASVQREMLYVLAEMRYEMFQQRLMFEQMLATISAAQLQNGQRIAKETLFRPTG